MQRSRETAAGDHYDQAEAAFRNALSLDENNAEATLGLAWVCNSRHRFDQGVEWAKKTLAIDPQNEDAYALLGDAAVELGDYDQAFEYYQKCLDLRPDLSSYSRAAHLLFLTGDARKAKWLMQKAIDAGGPHAENTAWCRAQLALMALNTGSLAIAQKQLEQALVQAPENRHLLAAMAKVKTARKEYEAAAEYCRQALAVAPDHDLLVALGDLYTLTGKPDQAQEQYSRVIAFHSGHHHGDDQPHAHPSEHGNAQLARFYADHDRHLEEALREAEKAYEGSKSVFVTDTLAWCYYKTGRYDEARQLIHQALRWNTPDANILSHAGMIYAKLGVRPAAQQYLYRALNLNPNFHPIDARVAAETFQELSSRNLSSERSPTAE